MGGQSENFFDRLNSTEQAAPQTQEVLSALAFYA